LENIDSHQAVIRARQALQRGDYVSARQFADLAARLNPEDEVPWLILAGLTSPQESLDYLHKALELNPKSQIALKGLAWAEERLRQETPAPVAAEPAPVLVSPEEKTQPIKLRRTAPVFETGKPGPSAPPESISSIEKNRPLRLHAVSATQSRHRWYQFWIKDETRSPENRGSSTFSRVAKYTLVRGITLFFTILASVYLIIYIANLGGYLDTIQKGLISEDINSMLSTGWLRDVSKEERQQTIDQTRIAMEASYGLNQPYARRVANWLIKSMTFDWGNSRFQYVISSTYVAGTHTNDILTNDIRTEILNYLPRTLLLLGLSNLGLFLISIVVALLLTRHPGSWVDKVFTALSPTSAAPSWMFGLVIIILLVRVLGINNFSVGRNVWRTTFSLDVVTELLRVLLLPFLAIFLSKFFQSVYSWRAYFLTFSNESYIELAKAKGLPPAMLERRYLLRPAMPTLITSFALIMISIWQECIAVEYFFNVGGIGSFFVDALAGNEIGIIVALVATFAYFLAFTVFILDIVYSLVDPRLKIQTDAQRDQPFHPGSWFGDVLRLLRGKTALQGSTRPSFQQHRVSFSQVENQPFSIRIRKLWQSIAREAQSLKGFLHDLSKYPSALIGVGIIGVLIIISIGTVIAIPYSQAIRIWRGDDQAFIRNPKEVPPAWTNFFRSQKLPENIQLNSRDGTASKAVQVDSDGNTTVTMSFQFDYRYDSLPQDVMVQFTPIYNIKQPFITITWVTPDGREIALKNIAVSRGMLFFFNTDNILTQKFGRDVPVQVLFSKPGSQPGEIVQGRYEMRITGFLFEGGSNLDAEMVVYGQVFGLAGTDSHRKDLLLVLLWGIVAALSFGILAAIFTTFSSVTLAAAGAWFGGWVDGVIQRISEINMVLPVLPISILIFYLYSKSFWVILGVTVGLSIFGNSVKNYRAMFLQIKQLSYIEAASTYGASGWRIIFKYMIPRVRSVLIPQLIILVPGYIFFESTLSFLGVSDPFLPTLGKLLVATLQEGISGRPIYLLLEPVGLLVLIALAFALPGFALERMYNEKLGV
jgi:peptide/nickel transport system permease protein